MAGQGEGAGSALTIQDNLNVVTFVTMGVELEQPSYVTEIYV